MPSPRLGRVLTAMVTPFHDDGSLDLDGAVALAGWLLEHGNDGLVLAGTTGEAPTLSDDEAVELWTAVRAAVDAPLVAGVGSNDTRHTCGLAERAAAAGIDGLLVVTPYYNRPSQAGLDAHFRAVAGATDLPVVLYDIPGRTGRKISSGVLIALACDVPNVVGLKDAAGDPGQTARVIASAPADFSVWSGDDPMTLPLLAIGAVGVIGTATHWCGEIMADLVSSFVKGDHDRARELNAALLDSYHYESRETAQFALAVKVVLRLLGQPAGPCRLPIGPEPDDLEAEAQRVLRGLDLLA